MRTDRATGSLGEVVDGFHILRLCRIRVDIENKHAAVFEPGEPELAAIVGESAVMRLVASLDRIAVDDFAVGRRAGLYIHGDQLVRAVAQTFNAERPHINEL